jgi:hypothetical protein
VHTPPGTPALLAPALPVDAEDEAGPDPLLDEKVKVVLDVDADPKPLLDEKVKVVLDVDVEPKPLLAVEVKLVLQMGADPASVGVQSFAPSSEQQDRGSGYVWEPGSHAWNGAAG